MTEQLVTVGVGHLTTLLLGKQGENLARRITFDCSALTTAYGPGAASLLAKTPDAILYPVATVQQDDMVYWNVSNSDTLTAGLGECELQWHVGEMLAKSVTYQTRVRKSLASETEAPEPQQIWVDQVLKAANGTQAASQSAGLSAERAAGSATAAAKSEEEAKRIAESASSSATAAAGSATAAAKSEEAVKEIADSVGNVYTRLEIDTMIPLLLTGDKERYFEVMRAWFAANHANSASAAELTALCNRWYEITRTGWDGSTMFYQPDVSAVSFGERGGDNAGLSCTPSTDTTANQDDYAGLPLFACIDCNWVVDADTLEPVITAIDGITDNFVRNNPDVYVGVLQMAGYHWWSEDDDTYTHGYCDSLKSYANIEPVPESVRVDGTVRPWVVHAKYMAQKTSAGALTCCAGVIPTGWMSHNSTHIASNINGSQYSGTASADDAWLKLMCYIKYASLTLDGILQGCCNMNYQYPALVAESGVKRILITTAQAANFEVGMGVLLGNYTSTVDRNDAGMCSITGQAGALITSIETVTIDGVEYGAIYVDTNAAFNTMANGSAVAGTTYISSFHWLTGKTDGVLGNDGSPVDCTSGKYPARLQGIEYMVGGYEVIADSILSLYADDEETYWYEPYIARLSASQSTSITTNYEASGVRCKRPDTAAWMYIKKLGYAKGVFFPVEVGGGSSTYTKDAFYMNVSSLETREWLARGPLTPGSGSAGLSCLHGGFALSLLAWSFLARLSASGNRGEWTA